MNEFHKAGKRVVLAAFGSDDKPTTWGFDAVETCQEVADFVLNNNLDGVNLDYLDSEACEAGTCEDWVIDCVNTVRATLPYGEYIVTLSPPAPYFQGVSYYDNGAFRTVHDSVGDQVDWYNTHFYNQEDNSYDSYELLFTESGSLFDLTSIKQLNEYAGIPLEKIVLGKPVNSEDLYNTGLVDAADLGSWAAQAEAEFGWNTGIYTWQYDSDTDGEFVIDFCANSGFSCSEALQANAYDSSETETTSDGEDDSSSGTGECNCEAGFDEID